jgi:hypothetical protein
MEDARFFVGFFVVLRFNLRKLFSASHDFTFRNGVALLHQGLLESNVV